MFELFEIIVLIAIILAFVVQHFINKFDKTPVYERYTAEHRNWFNSLFLRSWFLSCLGAAVLFCILYYGRYPLNRFLYNSDIRKCAQLVETKLPEYLYAYDDAIESVTVSARDSYEQNYDTTHYCYDNDYYLNVDVDVILRDGSMHQSNAARCRYVYKLHELIDEFIRQEGLGHCSNIRKKTKKGYDFRRKTVLNQNFDAHCLSELTVSSDKYKYSSGTDTVYENISSYINEINSGKMYVQYARNHDTYASFPEWSDNDYVERINKEADQKAYERRRQQEKEKQGSSSNSGSHSTSGGAGSTRFKIDSYDKGYDDAYFEGEYDEERYDRDLDYALGVDDAMEDLGEDW